MFFRLINLLKISTGIPLIICAIVFYSTALAFNGPHILAENPCDVCHIPHHAADDILWAKKIEGPFRGVKRLCSTCHGTGLYGAKDIYGIFETSGDNTYDHVMGENASVDGQSVIRQDWNNFPLKEESEVGDGFYCGSCHDPHKDPYEPLDNEGGGDYLREEIKEVIKNPHDKETTFCIQCHKGIITGDAYGHGDRQGCFDCHHPHNSPNSGSKILISPMVSFVASPNCPGFVTSEAAAACYGCHRENSELAGAIGAPLAGDDLPEPKEHHPMGLGADTSTIGHQPTQGGPLSAEGELSCNTCHTVHNGTNDRYINPDVILKLDPKNTGDFCIACHSDKIIEDLGRRGENHHQIEPYNQCLFCHSIHNSPNDPDALYQTDEDEADQDNSSASVDVIMRVKPVNLAWADKSLDFDIRDYEDACYGCHSSPEIVGSESWLNEDNALLLDNVRDKFFSHKYNAIPSASIRTLNTFEDRLPIVSDGKITRVKNDYSVEENRIWCGSCHNVHYQNRFPAEIPEEYQKRRSAYLRDENYGSSFCYKCHIGYHEDTAHGGPNHPQDIMLEGQKEDIMLEGQKVKADIIPLYFDGYSGGIGGITNGLSKFDTRQGEVVCQTCHNVHTAGTDGDGRSNKDDKLNHGKLIVKPIDEGFCQDCHDINFHGHKIGNCLPCHHPHRGIKRVSAPSIYFIAQPNVPEEIKDEPSSLCYACHQPHHLYGDNYNFWRESGAAPIYGDKTGYQTTAAEQNNQHRKDHHPMGSKTNLTGTGFMHAPGEFGEYLNASNQITCVTCHDIEEGEKENNFLRWNFKDDDAQFCIECHTDKIFQKGIDGKHFRNNDSPLTRRVFDLYSPSYEKEIPCRQCMFCHFIHDGEEREEGESPPDIRPDITVLMRKSSINLAWGDKFEDTDKYDYEDMCYGCHNDPKIVGEGCEGAQLREDFFTHPFALKLSSDNDPNKPPTYVIKAGGRFPLSDGDNSSTLNDYGTEEYSMFCGTCHNVHDNKVSPYLNYDNGDTRISSDEPKPPSPYEPEGFCEFCHDPESAQIRFVHNSHPINRGPNPPATKEEWEPLYNNNSGKGGCEGGVTYNNRIICLTCHNVHAAATSWQGGTTGDEGSNKHGKILVKDNFKNPDSGKGSDLCKDCHNVDTNQ